MTPIYSDLHFGTEASGLKSEGRLNLEWSLSETLLFKSLPLSSNL